MQSNRIIIIQRRAKRRLLVLAIAATAFVGYTALSLFAEDGRPLQPTIEKMDHVPGVKAVGIRMINANEKLPAARIETAPAMANKSASISMPPSAMPNLETSTPSTKGEFTLPPPFLSLPTSALTTTGIVPNEKKSPSGFLNLSAPPRTSDVSEKSRKGPLVVRIAETDKGKDPLTNRNLSDVDSPESSQIVSGPDLIDIRVVQPRSMSQPAKIPPRVIEKIDSKSDTSSAPSTMATIQSKVRIAISDSSATGEFSPQTLETPIVTQLKSRFPQLVKSKPTQITHTVVLAQSTNLDLQSTTDQSDEFVPPVQIDSSLVPHAISSRSEGYHSTTDKPLESAIAQAVPGIFALHKLGASNEPQLLAKPISLSLPMDSIDKLRRSFDASTPIQSPLATVELVCLAATTMNLAGNLTAIAVQDENVCKALHNERTISLVGNQSGTTLVQFWTAESGGMPQVVRVNVSQQWGRAQARRSDVNDIRQVIAQGFPRSEVKIFGNEDGTFEVRGTTDSEESARRILELVRKIYLVPVKDRLSVSN